MNCLHRFQLAIPSTLQKSFWDGASELKVTKINWKVFLHFIVKSLKSTIFNGSGQLVEREGAAVGSDMRNFDAIELSSLLRGLL